jgi:hypothetical protein
MPIRSRLFLRLPSLPTCIRPPTLDLLVNPVLLPFPCALIMSLTFKPLTMRFPFVKTYLPVSQKDVVDGSQDLEEGSGCSSSEFDSREKIFTLAVEPSIFSLFKRWLPWLLCFCLFVSNIRLWMKLKGLVFDDAVYCK